MEAERRGRLERVMAGIAAGDRAMVVGLAVEFDAELRSSLVAIARAEGLPRPRGRVLDSLVFAAAEAIEPVAGGWRADGGALPWVWARRRLVLVLRDEAGPPVTLRGLAPPPEADVHDAGVSWTAEEPDAVVVLARAAVTRPEAALVRAALDLALPRADHELFHRYAQQLADGDPSPAVTVGREVARSPAAVRQAAHRGRTRLRRLALADRRFEPLLRLPLLGPAAERAA
jgi:hypothetical protein